MAVPSDPGAYGELVAVRVPRGHAGLPHAPAHALPAHAHALAQRAPAALTARHQVSTTCHLLDTKTSRRKYTILILSGCFRLSTLLIFWYKCALLETRRVRVVIVCPF